MPGSSFMFHYRSLLPSRSAVWKQFGNYFWKAPVEAPKVETFCKFPGNLEKVTHAEQISMPPARDGKTHEGVTGRCATRQILPRIAAGCVCWGLRANWVSLKG